MVKIFVCGDILLRFGNEKILSDELRKRISDNNIVLGNFEGPIESKGVSLPKAGPCLCQHKNALKILRGSGFNVLSLANNHIMDFGSEGLENTLAGCKREGFRFTGAGLNRADAFKPVIVKVKDMNIAILSFAEREFGAIDPLDEKPGYAWICDPLALESIKKAKEGSDIVIVCAHVGNEEVPFPSIYRQLLFRQFIDSGADIVIGNHPHVPQGWEKHGAGYIFYSLGNFFFNSSCRSSFTKFDWSICVEIVLTDKKIKEIETLPVKRINNEYVDIIQTGREKYLGYLSRLNQIIPYANLLLPYWQETAVYLFYNRYRYYLKRALLNDLSVYHSIKTQVKRLLNYLFKKDFYIENKNFNKLLLLNLFRNESHRWAIETALAVLNKDITDLRTHETSKRFNAFLDWEE